MARLLPSSPSIPRLIPRSCRIPPTQTWVDRCPQPIILPRAKFPPIFRALSRTARCASPPPALFVLLATGTRPCPAPSAPASNLNLKPL